AANDWVNWTSLKPPAWIRGRDAAVAAAAVRGPFAAPALPSCCLPDPSTGAAGRFGCDGPGLPHPGPLAPVLSRSCESKTRGTLTARQTAGQAVSSRNSLKTFINLCDAKDMSGQVST